MVKKLAHERSEILEPLYAVTRDLMKVEENNKGHLIKYTDADVAAAVFTFNHIITNRMAWQLFDERSSLEEVLETASGYSKKINHIVYEMTGFDLTEGVKDNG